MLQKIHSETVFSSFRDKLYEISINLDETIITLHIPQFEEIEINDQPGNDETYIDWGQNTIIINKEDGAFNLTYNNISVNRDIGPGPEFYEAFIRIVQTIQRYDKQLKKFAAVTTLGHQFFNAKNISMDPKHGPFAKKILDYAGLAGGKKLRKKMVQ